MNEVSAAFAHATFIIIRCRRSSAANKLVSHMPTQSRIWKSIDQLTDACRELPQPI